MTNEDLRCKDEDVPEDVSNKEGCLEEESQVEIEEKPDLKYWGKEEEIGESEKFEKFEIKMERKLKIELRKFEFYEERFGEKLKFEITRKRKKWELVVFGRRWKLWKVRKKLVEMLRSWSKTCNRALATRR